MARKTVSMIESPDKTQSDVWDFPVAQKELENPFDRTKNTGVFGVFRTDTNEYIGQYKGEKVLPYQSLTEGFETALNDGGFSFKRSILTTSNGARFFARYDIGNGLEAGGEGFQRILRLQSSHDGSLTPGFAFEAMRLACLNGMMGLATLCAIFRRHSEKFDLKAITGNVQDAIEKGETKTRETIDGMTAIRVNDDQARNIVSNLVVMGKSNGVSPKTGHLIYHNWQNPSEDEKPLGDTLYRLYNATTRFTRDVENVGRFELSRRANVFVTGAFDLGLRQKYSMERLFGEPAEMLDFDGVSVNN